MSWKTRNMPASASRSAIEVALAPERQHGQQEMRRPRLSASQEEIAYGIYAAGEVFARYRAHPLHCVAAHLKRADEQLLSKQELLLCLIWDEASDKAWQAVRRRVMGSLNQGSI
jgi:acyl-CoA reductase-like NAD-dependent aldehyde dehydrogenase